MKILISLISYVNPLSDLIKILLYPKKFPNSLWIQPLLTIILINSKFNHKNSEFEKKLTRGSVL